MEIDWKTFNAGPSAIEALFANEVDIGYIGPNPAINGYVKSKGEALRIIAGATSGGAGLVVRADAGIKKISDFRGKKIATPQLGNTQDIMLRHWLRANNLKTKEQGGGVEVIPIKNPDQLVLFLKKEIDAAWAPEPWVSRLIKEGNGRLFLDERSLWKNGRFAAAVLIVRKKFLDENSDLVKKWLAAHNKLTYWINANKSRAKVIVNAHLKELTGKSLPKDIIDSSYSMLSVVNDPMGKAVLKSADFAFEEGFLGKTRPDLKGLFAEIK